MNDHDNINDARAAQIDRRIDQSFAFARDVISDPKVLDDIPGGSTLRFRNARVSDHVFHLVAFLPKAAGGRWGARVTNTVIAFPNGQREAFFPRVEGKESAAAALDALEAALR